MYTFEVVLRKSSYLDNKTWSWAVITELSRCHFLGKDRDFRPTQFIYWRHIKIDTFAFENISSKQLRPWSDIYFQIRVCESQCVGHLQVEFVPLLRKVIYTLFVVYAQSFWGRDWCLASWIQSVEPWVSDSTQLHAFTSMKLLLGVQCHRHGLRTALWFASVERDIAVLPSSS